MSDIDVNGIRFFPSYYSTIMSIPDDGLRLKAFEVVTTYMMTGQEPEEIDWQIKVILEALRPNIDKSRDASERGSKGGRPKKASEKEVLQTEKQVSDVLLESEKQIEREEEVEIEKEVEVEKGVEKGAEKEKKEKHKHGEYAHVLLTDDELSKLEEEYGKEETASAIQFLDEYIEMKGAKYKSHYLAMRKWVFNAVKEHQSKNDRAAPGGDYWDELLKGVS